MDKTESLGTLIDQLYATRQKRLDITREVDALKSEERAMRATIIDMLDATGLAKASGALATCGIITSIEPIVNDWDEVHKYIRENNRFDLLQKRISTVAWRDLFTDGTIVPGTEDMTVTDVSLTKSTRS